MTFALTMVAFAEGFAFDSRGNPTLVGFEPAGWPVSSFPASINTNVVIIAQHDADGLTPDEVQGRNVALSVVVTDPAGQVLYFAEEETPVPPPQSGDALLARLQAFIPLAVTVSKPGLHTLTATLRDVGGEASSYSRTLRVFEPSDDS